MLSMWRFLFAMLLACVSFSASAETFKCKLADGSTTYQDTPCMQSGATQQVAVVSGSVLGLSMSEAGMLGLRSGIQKRVDSGTISKVVASCLQGFDNYKLYNIFQKILSENMSAADLKAANEFFDSPTGRKFAKRELATAYRSVGMTPPPPVPVLSTAESNQVAEFIASPAGQMLITRRFMMTATTMPIVSERIGEMMKECGARRY